MKIEKKKLLKNFLTSAKDSSKPFNNSHDNIKKLFNPSTRRKKLKQRRYRAKYSTLAFFNSTIEQNTFAFEVLLENFPRQSGYENKTKSYAEKKLISFRM